jgi:putative membrane protein insertion efficiency factor
MIKSLLLSIILIYRKVFTVLDFGSCRFYPTCSQYAKINISYNNIFLAIFYSTKRILFCNQYTKGGIDYPKIHINKVFIPPFIYTYYNFNRFNIMYWLVCTNDKKHLYWISNFTTKVML